MVGGPWRDTVVRFGYDVRADVASRVYQRVFLRGPAARLRSPSKGHEEEEEDDDEVARSSVVPLPSERTRSTHLFDGTTLHRHVGNFQLCDVLDPLITPFIWRENDATQDGVSMGTQWLRETWDAETGWYTKRALELIRALITARFKALADTGTALQSREVDIIVNRMRQKWREEDMPEDDGEGAHEEMQVGDAAQVRMDHVDPSLV
jgi:general transcription factor 3C polypeptide 5 (transcription factor C subunit 1)